MFGMNGGTPRSAVANNASASAWIMSIVHGLSAVAWVAGRHPQVVCYDFFFDPNR